MITEGYPDLVSDIIGVDTSGGKSYGFRVGTFDGATLGFSNSKRLGVANSSKLGEFF